LTGLDLFIKQRGHVCQFFVTITCNVSTISCKKETNFTISEVISNTARNT